MKLLLIVFCGLAALPGSVGCEEDLVLSSAEQAFALSCDPKWLLGGVVSPLNGQVVLKCTDLVARGAQDIAITRNYVAPHMPRSFSQVEALDRERLYEHLVENYVGWQFLPHLCMQVTKHDAFEFRFANRDGVMLDYRLSVPDLVLTFVVSLDGALTNVLGDEPSGRYDIRNTRIIYSDEEVKVHDPDGTIRYYECLGRVNPHEKKHFYYLQKEVLPNGKILRYHYNEKKQPVLIESLNPNESIVYASIQIERGKDQCRFFSSSSTDASYLYDRRQILLNAKEKGKWGQRLHDILVPCPPVLTGVSSSFYRHESMNYCNRSLLVEYRGKERSFNSVNATFTGLPSDEPHYQVAALFSPWQGTFERTCSMDYAPPILKIRSGTTMFKHIDGSTAVYHFSSDFLITWIQYFGKDDNLKWQKSFEWTDNRRLRSVEVFDGQDLLLYKKSYESDHFGNPALEIITGDLAGDGVNDSETISRYFSYDGRNLLVMEEHENGKIINCEYLPSTNLLTERITFVGNEIATREFFDYDDSYNLIRKEIDDGKSRERGSLEGMTQRTITEYVLRKEPPFLHMPEWVDEKYVEDSCEKLLKRKHFHYDIFGNVCQEDIYGSDGVLAFTLYRKYNERGDLLSETNALGQTASYTYDEKGRCISSLDFDHNVEKRMSYDRRDNLIELQEIGRDGIVHTTVHEYDLNNDLLKTTDAFNNETRYIYDPLVHKPNRTLYPHTYSLNGQIVDVPISCTYDVFGRLLTQTDGNGNTTSYKYTATGSVKEITHPNGYQEQFRYLNGNLVVYVNQEGHKVLSTYDSLGRVLTKRYRTASGKWMGEESFTYNSFHLLKETDREGNATHYVYDGAGRKIRMEKSGRVTEYFYDSLGRESAVCSRNGNNSLWTRYTRDLLDRILEEMKTDETGTVLSKVSYRYDVQGNCSAIIRHNDGAENVDQYEYDSFKRQIAHTDACGNVTTTSYHERYRNPWGQYVLQKTTVNPENIKTVETLNVRFQVNKKEVFNAENKIIAAVGMDYDANGNMVTKQEHIYQGEVFVGKQVTRYSYSTENQLESVLRNFGTNDVRIFSFLYAADGKLSRLIRPDGIVLEYTYNSLGYLQSVRSSDKKIQHVFTYNRLGHLIKVYDEVQKVSVVREVDSFGNVLREKNPKNVVIGKTYDCFDRPLSLEISDEGKVLYQYDPLFLRGVARTSPSGDILYTHVYERYDCDGKLLSEKGIDGMEVKHVRDPKGRKISIAHPCFSEERTFNSTDCLIREVIDHRSHDYSYDALSSLTSEKRPGYQASYRRDSLGNLIEKNGNPCRVSEFNELLEFEGVSCTYDQNSNLIQKTTADDTFNFTYDPLDRLTEVVGEKQKVQFRYDPLGRKIHKIVYNKNGEGWKEERTEYYLYDGHVEIGSFDKRGKIINLRVMGNRSPVAIEIEEVPYEPVIDCEGNVRRLMDLHGTVVKSYSYTVNGEIPASEDKGELLNPWRFGAERLHPELGLVDWGKRFYDPELFRTLTPEATSVPESQVPGG